MKRYLIILALCSSVVATTQAQQVIIVNRIDPVAARRQWIKDLNYPEVKATERERTRADYRLFLAWEEENHGTLWKTQFNGSVSSLIAGGMTPRVIYNEMRAKRLDRYPAVAALGLKTPEEVAHQRHCTMPEDIEPFLLSEE